MPTKAEALHMRRVAELGCLICRLQERGYVPPAIHHVLTEGGRRMGHLYVLPLCDPGHHKGAPKSSGQVSRHPNKAAFERAYGTEKALLARVTKLLKARYG